jgi:hypothetical protein
MTDEPTTELLPALLDHYDVETRHVRNSSRSDWEVVQGTSLVASAVEAPDFIDQLRRFFMAMDVEVEQYRNDPIATGQALAKIDALLADLRSVRATLNTATAEALARYQVRRLVIQGIAVMEASSTYDRHAWRHEDLLPAALRAFGVEHLVNTETGEAFTADDLAVRILAVLTPSWKLTGLRAIGLDPDDWCEFTSDDNGRPARVPTVRFNDNAVRTPHRGVAVKAERGDG